VEAKKLAFEDRAKYYADPAFESLQDNEQYIDMLRRVGFDV
jgi:gamma-glutamyltranspeptidase